MGIMIKGKRVDYLMTRCSGQVDSTAQLLKWGMRTSEKVIALVHSNSLCGGSSSIVSLRLYVR